MCTSARHASPAPGWAHWSACRTLPGSKASPSGSRVTEYYVEFSDLVTEIALMLADLAGRSDGVARIGGADDILAARQRGAIGFLPIG